MKCFFYEVTKSINTQIAYILGFIKWLFQFPWYVISVGLVQDPWYWTLELCLQHIISLLDNSGHISLIFLFLCINNFHKIYLHLEKALCSLSVPYLKENYSIMKTNSEFLKYFGPVGKNNKNIQCPIDSGSMSVQMTGTCWHNNLHKSD